MNTVFRSFYGNIFEKISVLFHLHNDTNLSACSPLLDV